MALASRMGHFVAQRAWQGIDQRSAYRDTFAPSGGASHRDVTGMLDRDIRPALLRAVNAEHPGATLFEEFPVCRNGRADIAVVNESLWGYEIKSERDSLNRLPRQVEQYEAIFDFCIIVAGERHLKNVNRFIPSHWGIIAARGSSAATSIEPVRNPIQNKNRRMEDVIQLLWKTEASKALRTHGVKVPSNAPVLSVWRMLANLPRAEIEESVRAALKSRNG